MTVFLAGLCSALAAGVIGYFISGLTFRRYRLRTPETWRATRMRNYVLEFAADLVFGMMFAGFFWLTGGIGWLNVGQWPKMGFLFGIGCWGAVALPMVLSMSVVVNLHRGVVAGFLIEWLGSSIAAGLICAFLIERTA